MLKMIQDHSWGEQSEIIYVLGTHILHKGKRDMEVSVENKPLCDYNGR